jgi:hypothetical protein
MGGRGVIWVLTESHVDWLCRVGVGVCEEIEICGVWSCGWQVEDENGNGVGMGWDCYTR